MFKNRTIHVRNPTFSQNILPLNACPRISCLADEQAEGCRAALARASGLASVFGKCGLLKIRGHHFGRDALMKGSLVPSKEPTLSPQS